MLDTRIASFPLFRRGIPLAGLAFALAIALLVPESKGWALLAAIAILADIQSTFNTGNLYLAKRSAIVRWDGFWLKVLRPFFKFINMEEPWLLSFCEWNNKRVTQAFRKKRGFKPIVLLPHCTQFTKCNAHVVENLQTCFRCNKCVIMDAADAAKHCGWKVTVSPRSRMAYNTARKFHPDVVIAVACPDRLVKGLTKLCDIPSYAIPLELPHGMCIDTTFDFLGLKRAMDTLAEPSNAPNVQPLKINVGT